jgi:mannose/fructose/N-acetylgalactosamine-specific phosphotransferase system component IIC
MDPSEFNVNGTRAQERGGLVEGTRLEHVATGVDHMGGASLPPDAAKQTLNSITINVFTK